MEDVSDVSIPTTITEQRADGGDVATRDQLLIAAGQLMIERNSIDISLSEIAQKSGLNSALVKYYFGNKCGLLMALLRMALGPSVAQLDHLLAMPVSPPDKLRIHISGVVNSYYRHPYVNRLVHQILTDDGATYGVMIADEITKPIVRTQTQILAEGLASGDFRAIDPMLFYYHVIGACDHLFYGRYTLMHAFGINDISDELKRRYVDHLCSVVLNGVGPDEPPRG